MTAPADAMRCPICLKLECDRHSLHQQQEALRGVVFSATACGWCHRSDNHAKGCRNGAGPVTPGITVATDPASPTGDRMVSVGMMRGMDGTMEVVEVKPRRKRGKLSIRG